MHEALASTEEIGLILSGVSILQDLEYEAIEDIAERIHGRRFGRGETLIKRGAPGECLYILFDGQVEVRVPNLISERDRCITLGKGAVLGEISILTGKPASADVIALEETRAFMLDREQFNQLIDRYSRFAETMTALMSERLALDGEFSRVGHYSLQNKLGQGNMAIVYDAFDPTLNRFVAIKMLKYELSHNQAFLKRFEREARIIAGLSHPNIVQVHAVVEEYSTRFMVMEKLHGRDLAWHIKQGGAMAADRARAILAQVATALRYAHEHGIIHRDIKPSNIFIDEQGHVKLTDFGLSGPPLRETEKIVGTPLYLAPEIIKSEAVDGRADIYALGVTAFYMLAGRHPFRANSIKEILARHLRDRAPDIREIRKGLDKDLAEFIAGALEKDPARRVADWDRIEGLLNTGSTTPGHSPDRNEIGFEVYLCRSSQQQASTIIRQLQESLDKAGIEHRIRLRPPAEPS